MIATYSPRVSVHPDRYGKSRPLPPLWVVLHTSEGAEGDGAAEALARYMQQPGDRPSSSGGRYGSSYHAVADTGLKVIPCVDDDRVSYSAPGSNTEGLHICIPGKAGQTRDQWLTGSTRAAITTVAAFLLDTRDRYGIPVERLTAAEVESKTRGYCDHATIRDAFGLTTHYDVGPEFPWDVLTADVRDLSKNRPTGDTMQTVNKRMSDTRKYGPGGRLTPFKPHYFALPDEYKTARACQISVAVVEPAGPGYLLAAGAQLTDTSFCNYSTGTIQGTTIVELDGAGIYIQASSACFVVIDLQAVWM
jgi:hypothetical protein